MSQSPLITTVIPTYRRPHLVGRAIRSVLNQAYSNLRVCVCDNASGDATRSVVEGIAREDSRVEYYCHLSNIGANANFQFGLGLIKTELFSLLSDDDLLLPDFFKIGVDTLDRYPGTLLFAGATLRADYKGRIWDVPLSRWKEGIYPPPTGVVEMVKKGHPEWTGAIFRRDVLSRVSLADCQLATGMAHDLHFELIIAGLGPIFISNQPCAIFFSHPGSPTARGGLDHFWPGHYRLLEELEAITSLTPQQRRELRRTLKRRLMCRIIGSALRAVSRGQTEEVLRAAQILDSHFQQPVIATAIRKMTGSNGSLEGCLLRLGARTAVWGRQQYRRALLPHYWRGKYGDIVTAFL